MFGFLRSILGTSSKVPKDQDVEKQNKLDERYRAVVSKMSPYLLPTSGVLNANTSSEASEMLVSSINELKSILHDRPDSWAIYWFLGKAYQSLGEAHASHESFEKAFELERTNEQVAHAFMNSCLELGQHEKAVSAAEQAVQLKPMDAGLVAKLALAYLLAGRMEEASRMARVSQTVDPDDIETHQIHKLIEEVRTGRRVKPRSFSELQSV